MFKKLVALSLTLPLISALQIAQPTSQVYSSSPLTVTWTVTSGDPATFDLYLTNSDFHNTFALKNSVTTTDGNVTIALPVVPAGSGYTLQASPVGNVNSVLSQTSPFNIADALSSSSSLSSTLGSSGTGLPSSGSNPSGSTPTSTPKSTPLTSSSSSSSTAVPTGGSFNGNGALSVTGIGGAVVGVLVAAGAFFAF